MRIGFLFNHDQIHQVAHSLPIALALADSDRDLDVIVATTSEVLRREVDWIVTMRGGGVVRAWCGSVRKTRLTLRNRMFADLLRQP